MSARRLLKSWFSRPALRLSVLVSIRIYRLLLHLVDHTCVRSCSVVLQASVRPQLEVRLPHSDLLRVGTHRFVTNLFGLSGRPLGKSNPLSGYFPGGLLDGRPLEK